MAGGWDAFKLYFMIGLPTEKDEDIVEIARMAEGLVKTRTPKGNRGVRRVTVSIANFVPKPHTPFQWVSQVGAEELLRRQELIRGRIKDRRVIITGHHPDSSLLEGIFSRGDRRLGKLLLAAWRLGCRLDGWREHFRWDKWQEALTLTGIDPAFYNRRQRSPEEVLPWDHLSPGLDKGFLWQEYERALAGEITPDCSFSSCSQCGVCPTLELPIRLRGGDDNFPKIMGPVD